MHRFFVAFTFYIKGLTAFFVINIFAFFYIFHCKTISGVYYFGLGFYSKHNGDNLAYLELDNAVCSYFNQGENAVVNDRLFSLFLFDKRKFMQLLLRYNDEVKMEKHIE